MPVNITGVQGTLKAMRKFDPDLAKQMNKQIKGAMIPIRDKARSYAPLNSQMLSGWTKASSSDETIKYRAFPKYDQNETRDGIIYRQSANKPNRNGFQAAYFIANNSAGGAIFETSGRKNPNGLPSQASRAGKYSNYKDTSNRVNKSLNENAGRQFIASMGSLYGSPQLAQGRLIFRAWSEDQGRVTHSVNLAINTAVAKFNATNTQSAYGLAK
jgi:hypothetical protein